MREYLKELCDAVSINLVYTNNKIIVLSSSINENKPTIRAHQLFKDCNEEVALAIINYYSGIKPKSGDLKIIENYVEKNFESKKFRITAPAQEFKDYFTKAMTKEATKDSDDPSLVELKINMIKKVNFWGENMDSTQKNTINTKNSEMIELDIEVDDLN